MHRTSDVRAPVAVFRRDGRLSPQPLLEDRAALASTTALAAFRGSRADA